ncbi:MAG: acyl carrier protein [Magnetococcales bacterium]|nr:acyl carrier protein [Magnetococcales bacterium]
MDNFLEQLAGILDTDVPLTPDTLLKNVPEWDSLAWLHFMTLADDTYGKEVTGDDLIRCLTVRQLFELVS